MAKLDVSKLSVERLKELRYEIVAALRERAPDPPPFAETEAGKRFAERANDLSAVLENAQKEFNKADNALVEADEALNVLLEERDEAELKYYDEYEG